MHAQLHAHDTDGRNSSSFCIEKNAVCAVLFNERGEQLDGMFSPDFHLLVRAQVVVDSGGDDGGAGGGVRRGGYQEEKGYSGGGGGQHPSFVFLFFVSRLFCPLLSLLLLSLTCH